MEGANSSKIDVSTDVGRNRAPILREFLGKVLCYGYLLRVPLLTSVGIVAFCIGAFFPGTRLLLGNIFDISSFWGIFFVSWAAFLSASVVMITWRVVMLYGSERFFNYEDQRRLEHAQLQTSPNVRWRHLLIYGTVVALPVIGSAVYKSATLAFGWEVFAVALGMAVSLVSLIIVAGLQRFFTRPEYTGRPSDGAREISEITKKSPDTFIPAGIGPIDALLFSLSRRHPTDTLIEKTSAVSSRLPDSLRRFLERIGRGYVEYDKNGRAISVLPGHAAAAALLFLTLLLYVAAGWVKLVRLGEPPLFPTLSYVLLLAMLLCWALSGAAFFLDRYRIPLLAPLLLWLILSAFSPWSEYSYPVIPPEEGESPSSGTTGRISAANDGKMIVVAANGGGIQAAAWAAQVLTGLEEECRKWCDGRFDESIHLISSVSGGSVGTMYFLNEYEGGRLPEDTSELKAIVTRTQGSSLDEISWGVLYPDLMRTFLPGPFVLDEWDRGRALEVAWLRNDVAWNERKGIQRGLSGWRYDAENRNRPAVMFNTAVVETGQRLPLATTDLPQYSPGQLSYDRYFGSVDPRPDIPIVTASRLSASFPYVSPAARADVEVETGHLVDGGYYDNYGISSLVEWLDDELKNNPRITDVLVLEIRGARSGPGDSRTGDSRCVTEPKAPKNQTNERGWFSQILAPLQAVLNVRNTGQRTHNDVELGLLQNKWAEMDGHRVDIKRAVFEFDGADPPLSWHLTDQQKDRIQAEWREELNSRRDACAGWDRVQEFLSSKGEG